MSNAVAIINGVEVFSDKELRSVVNTRVEFADGSWCDVATGQVHCQGPGYLNIGTSTEQEVLKIVEETKNYTARNLEIDGVMADVNVQPHQSDQIEVTISGTASQVKGISVKKSVDAVCITEARGGSGVNVNVWGGSAVAMGTGSSVTIGSNNVVNCGNVRVSGVNITTNGDCSISSGNIFQRFASAFTRSPQSRSVVVTDNCNGLIKITVKLPQGGAVRLEDVFGTSVIGDTDGDLQVEASNGSVQAGRVVNANLEISGVSKINVAEVNGTLDMEVSGCGNIRVNGGKVSKLDIEVSGTGHATFDGAADKAKLEVSGCGSINVASVKNKPKQEVSGVGKIKVGNW